MNKEKIPNLDKICDGDKERNEAEIEAIKMADCKQFDQALKTLEDISNRYPDHPSPLNNQAQILRLLQKNEEAMDILNYILDKYSTDDFPVVLKQTFCQRAWLHLRNGRLHEAKQDFEASLALGNEGARKMLPRCDPYAAMCNAMLCEIMQKQYSVKE